MFRFLHLRLPLLRCLRPSVILLLLDLLLLRLGVVLPKRIHRNLNRPQHVQGRRRDRSLQHTAHVRSVRVLYADGLRDFCALHELDVR